MFRQCNGGNHLRRNPGGINTCTNRQHHAYPGAHQQQQSQLAVINPRENRRQPELV